MDNSKQLKAGAVLSYLQMGLSVIIGLLYTPVMLRLLGKNEYGLYNTVASTVSMLSILSFGFNAGYIRFFTERKKKNDVDAINRLNGLFLLTFLIIGSVALACGLFLTDNLDLVFKNGLTESELETAKKLMLILTVNVSLSFPLSVFADIISANEKFVFLKSIGIINTVLGPLVCIPVLLLGYKSVALVIVSLVLQILSGAINGCYVVFKLGLRFKFGKFERKVFSELFGYTVFIAVNTIIDQINWKIDYVLLGRFCGTASVAVYTVGSALHNYYLAFSTAISGVFTPRIHRIAEEKKSVELASKEFTELFIKVGRIQFIILSLVASGIVFFGKPFIYLWAGEGYENAYWVALILVIPVTVPLIQNIGIEIQRAVNKHKFRSVIYLIMAVFNLVVSIILCPVYGEVGVAIGTSISIIIANCFIMNWYYQKKCGIDILEFWKNILKLTPVLIVPVVVGILMNRFVNMYSIAPLLVCIVAYTVVYCLSGWLFLNEYERSLLKGVIEKVKR